MRPRQAHSEQWGSTEQPSSDLSSVQGHCHKGHVHEEVSVGSHLGAHGTLCGEGDMAHTLCPSLKHAGATLSEVEGMFSSRSSVCWHHGHPRVFGIF